MNSRLSMVLAGVFLLGAILAAYWGIKISQGSASSEIETQANSSPASAETALAKTPRKLADDAQRTDVVVLAREVPAGHLLTAEDLLVERLSSAPQGSFSEAKQALGQRVGRSLPAGTWLSETSLEPGGPLAQMIRANERALAVAVDEVIGAGGHLKPGDYVDVISVMQSSDPSERVDLAQVIAPGARVLTVGALLGPNLNGEPLQADADEKEAKPNSARSVVLAVPERLATRVALAAQSGQLRLAVRSAEEDLHLQPVSGVDQSAAIDERVRSFVSQAELSASKPKAATPISPAQGFNPSRSAPQSPRVEVLRAGQSSWQTP